MPIYVFRTKEKISQCKNCPFKIIHKIRPDHYVAECFLSKWKYVFSPVDIMLQEDIRFVESNEEMILRRLFEQCPLEEVDIEGVGKYPL